MDVFTSDEDEEAAALFVPNQVLRKPREFDQRRFLEDCSDKSFRERYRVPCSVLDHLEAALSARLQHPTRRSQALAPREQIKVFLHFLGSNSFYHDLGFSHGLATDTVFRTVHNVASAISDLHATVIKWPENVSSVPRQFREKAGFPSVAGCLDGTHVLVTPPKDLEDGFINRHQNHSLNVLGVCGPDLRFYYVYSSAPGRWHDSRVLQSSSLWTTFEQGQRPFEGAVLLGDSAYPCRDWLITPFPGNQVGAKLRFNEAHTRTRNTVERSFGVLKNRFYSLKTGLRVREMEFAARLTICAAIIHNLCIDDDDDGQDFDDGDGGVPANQEAPAQGNLAPVETRRQQLLQVFQ